MEKHHYILIAGIALLAVSYYFYQKSQAPPPAETGVDVQQGIGDTIANWI